MRHPARLFATAVLAAMTTIAVVALAADVLGGRGTPSRAGQRIAADGFIAQLGMILPPGMRPTPAGPATVSAPAPAAGVTGSTTASAGQSASGQTGAITAADAAGASAEGPGGAPSSRTGAAAPPATGPAAAETAGRPAASAATSAGRHKSRPAQRRLAAAVRNGHRPGEVTRSHYLRHLTGGPEDISRMQALGASDARHNRSGQQHVVLLDIGGQLGDGVLLSTTPRYVSYSALARAISAYVRGYHFAQRRGAPVTVAIGTNNDLQTTGWTGRQWASRVVQPVRRAAGHYRAIAVAGAIDIEPGFHVGPRSSRAWVSGFLAATRAPLIFNGSADGCSPDRPGSRCAHRWTAQDLAWVAGVASPHRISALPQVYNYTMADQWAMISLTARADGHRALRFHGPLTENAACRGDKNCPTMGSLAAWHALWNSLRALGPVSLPARTDLDVH